MLAVIVPQAAIAAIVIVMLGGSLAGANFFWPVRDVNLAEAVLLRDAGETVRLIGLGADPNGRFHVRRDISGAISRRVSPLEAAVIERRIEMVDLLLRHGATLGTTAQSDTLMCLAAARQAPDITAFLSAASGRPAPALCAFR